MSNVPKKRDLRGQFTGGEQDIIEMYELLKVVAEAKNWKESYYDYKAFGEHGPIKKLVFGFTIGADDE